MTPDQKKELVRRYYAQVWSQGDLKVVDELMTDDYENHDPATPGGCLRGRDAFKGLVTMFRTAFPDLQMTIQKQYVDGDAVVSLWTAIGTHDGPLMGIPPTHKRGQGTPGMTVTTFRGNRIVKDEAIWDQMGLLKELGVIPS